MIHPLFRLIASQPQMVVDHAGAYAELVGEEVAAIATAWKRRIALYAIALVCVAVFVGLGGVALLLWCALPAASMPAPWALLVIPLVPGVAAIVAITVARGSAARKAFATVREQIAADVAMLHEVSTS